ncbi:MAG TPA: metal-dependent hydrolase [Candidatus Acidoferrales bacterium]|nr:metal-dependent hydrolase [Candidatus Acidoferrales bacterium]
MDNLTHTAIGLFLSRAGLGRWSPLATPIVILAANAPDIDVLSAAGGGLNYLHYHRHLTHSLVGMPIMALTVVLVVKLIGRKPVHWLGAFCAALIAVASHLALDWTNVYGIRLLLPFSSQWQRLDVTGVVDLWIWGVLLLGVLGPFLARLVGSEISSGSVKPAHHGRGFAWFALLFVLLYDCGRGVLHARAFTALSSRLYQDSPPLRIAALPDAANPWRWYGLVETSGAYTTETIDLIGTALPGRNLVFQKPEASPALDAAARTTAFSEFLRFSQFPLWRVSPVPSPENGRLVEVFDMRFGTPIAPGFMVSAVVDSGLHVVQTGFQLGRFRPR